MAEILIHRCRLRLVRRGGWSWGPDPRALSQAVVRALPLLLAAALDGMGLGDEEREIAAPIRLRLRIGQRDLQSALAESPESEPSMAGPSTILLGRLQAALAEALAAEARSARLAPPADRALPPDPGGAPAWIEAPPAAAVSLGALLLRWRHGGGLVPRLALLPAYTLELWWNALVREAAERPGGEEPSAELRASLRREAEGLAPPEPAPGPGPPGREAALRGWVAAAVELVARCGLAAGHPAAVRALAEALPQLGTVAFAPEGTPSSSLPSPGPPSTGEAPPAPGVPAPRIVASAAPPARLPAPWSETEVHVASALPFLLLGPLSRMGYLETLAAVFTVAGLVEDLPLFVAALAHKVLPPPERGWRRLPAAVAAASALAGLAEAPEGPLADLARRAAPCLAALAADLAASLLAGHEPGRPLVLAAAGEGLLLAEADGVFPIAWSAGLAGLQPALARLQNETFLVPAGAATPALLRGLDANCLRFVTAAPPARREPWRPVRAPAGGRWWSNDAAAPGLARHASSLEAVEEGAERLWQALAVERPSAPGRADPDLDRHLTLAAGVALGTLAWTLWREREPVDPILALERLGDLDARVRFRAGSVHVLLPLGRRHRDLRDHGLLEPVREIPWLGGRTLEFGGG